MEHRLLLSLSFVLLSCSLLAQTQVVKGTVVDSEAKYPLIGATVQVSETTPLLGTTTNSDGAFELKGVPVGRHTIVAQYIGYKPVVIPNVLVTAGKEVILNIQLTESVEELKEIEVTASNKELPLNDLAKVSARTFSLEEVTRFSGGRNDVARLATSFAGVSAPNDSRNDIVVRGNSPTGLLWRIEGIPVPTTNHFATFGTTGGPVNALNTNLLRTSDFLTGAFPAEYGNANGAVFDVNFRNGNPDKFEFTGQLSAFSGLELMAEGPLAKSRGGSFVASYRYGIASLAATGTSATPYYQDFSFKANLGKTKLGTFEVFGLGGLSSIDFFGDEIETDDLFANPNQDAYVANELGVIGISHIANLSKTAWIKTTLGASTAYSSYKQDNLIRNAEGMQTNKYLATDNEDRENRFTITSTLNKKFNAKWNMRAGVVHEVYDIKALVLDADNRNLDDNGDGIPDRLLTIRDVDEQYSLTQVFAQAENKLTDRLSITAGLHSQYSSLSEDVSVEPRAAISYSTERSGTFGLAYGLHAQAVAGPILFLNEEVSTDVFARTNEDLGFMRSHHVVLSYDRSLGAEWRVKSEVYYQSLFDIPVERTPSSYSLINEGADFVFQEKGSLVNEGTGTNYGVELTIEKFFSKGYYVLMTTSVFESTYKGSDNIKRSTAFNTNYVYNLLLGKEWKFGRDDKNAWTLDTKVTTSGGRLYTPIDLEATRANAGREVLFNDRAFSNQLSAYFRWDVKAGVRINSKKNVSHQFFVDFQNLLNRENDFISRYNEVTDRIDVVKQNGFFPDVMYRIQF
jgi:hypothetical protein